MNIYTPEYQKAFELYLRRGVPINFSYKAEDSGYYIWRTQDDDKVRPEHAANEGQIFSYDNPPETGNPGDDYGCRCWAEEYVLVIAPSVAPAIFSILNTIIRYFKEELAIPQRWDNTLMSAHYYLGNGKPVTLSEIGHLDNIRKYYEDHYFDRFQKQILLNARYAPDGEFRDNFENSYDFEDAIYSYGGSTIKGEFSGFIKTINPKEKIIYGTASIKLIDEFTDPLSIREIIVKGINKLPFVTGLSEEKLPDIIRAASELGGTKYPITGNWNAEIRLYINE